MTKKCKYCGKEFETQQGLDTHIGMEHPEKNKNMECDYCGKKFHKNPSKVNNHNFCSKECHNKFRRKRVTIKCDYCGKEIQEMPSKIKKHEHHFCSEECHHKWQKGKNHPRYKPKITKTCEQCGEKFQVKPSRKDTARFCSRECLYKWVSKPKNTPFRGEHHTKEAKKKISEAKKKPKIVKTCKQCGGEFKVIPARKDKKFCSMECMGKWRSENMKGKNNPNYKKVTKVCKQCGEEFKVIPCKEDTIDFCSRECYHKWNRGENNPMCGKNHPEMGGKENPNWKPKVTKICEYCGKKFKVIPSKKDTARFCSRECYHKWLSNYSEIGKKVLKSVKRKPTSIEQKFIGLCEKFNLPYKYVGAGDFWIKNKNPDFINVDGKKTAVEILGDYWHTRKGFKERKEKFKEYGWKCIGIWGHELNNLPEEKIVDRVKNER